MDPGQSAAHQAGVAAGAVLDDPEGRVALAGRCLSPAASRVDRSYHRALLRFVRWEANRGVLNATTSVPAGSPWWRSVNYDLLAGLYEAHLLSRGAPGSPSGPVVERWLTYLSSPSPDAWFLAHNRAIVDAYAAHQDLALEELDIERFVMNFTLVRLFYAHALVVDRTLALGALAPLAPILGSPRAIERFILVPRMYPVEYPMEGRSVEDLLGGEHWIGRTIDFGVILPRVAQLYAFAADALDAPHVLAFVIDRRPSYGSPAPGSAGVWDADHTDPGRSRPHVATRWARRLFAVRAGG
jgi:hypothetical protein